MVEEAGEHPGRITNALTKIFAGGLARYFGVRTSDDALGMLGRRIEDLKQKATATTAEAFTGALEDPTVQEKGQDFVGKTVEETVDGIKKNFSQTLTDVEQKVKTQPEDRRSNYKKARELLGTDANDKWYIKIAKNAAARIIAWSIPVTSIVSARVAARMTDTDQPGNVDDYRRNFHNIYSSLLSRLSPRQPTALGGAT